MSEMMFGLEMVGNRKTLQVPKEIFDNLDNAIATLNRNRISLTKDMERIPKYSLLTLDDFKFGISEGADGTYYLDFYPIENLQQHRWNPTNFIELGNIFDIIEHGYNVHELSRICKCTFPADLEIRMMANIQTDLSKEQLESFNILRNLLIQQLPLKEIITQTQNTAKTYDIFFKLKKEAYLVSE
jgi:hypothetical protein